MNRRTGTMAPPKRDFDQEFEECQDKLYALAMTRNMSLDEYMNEWHQHKNATVAEYVDHSRLARLPSKMSKDIIEWVDWIAIERY